MPAALALVVLCEERFSAAHVDSAAADLTHKTTCLGLLPYNSLGTFVSFLKMLAYELRILLIIYINYFI